MQVKIGSSLVEGPLLLKEREHSATEQLHLLIQKQKQTEEEFGRKLQELQAELASSNELRQKLERKESTCEMKRSIEAKDRKLIVLSEKINTHLLLFDSIEKEAFLVKQVVDNVQHLVSAKEEMITLFLAEKISELESKLRTDRNEFQRKDTVISELEGQLEAARISNNYQSQIEEISIQLLMEILLIQNLISEKKALHFEVGSLGFILQKIQDTVKIMNEEDKRIFSSILGSQEECAMVRTVENNRIEHAVQHSREEDSPHKASGRGTAENKDAASPLCQEYNSVGNYFQENNNFNSCSACSQPQSASNVQSNSANEAKDNCSALIHHLDCQSSTTWAETSEDPASVCCPIHLEPQTKLYPYPAGHLKFCRYVEDIATKSQLDELKDYDKTAKLVNLVEIRYRIRVPFKTSNDNCVTVIATYDEN
ncbi:hypothetical protein L1049_007120 [Liquidambar formosana]|uniref:Uncharacterized protein n=1 Tax=Liquidambar formosana TaxID=63359 RepID=A0AAP0RGP2_LIQFO